MENKIEIFKSSDNRIELKVQFDKNTVWLSQRQMAELFDKDSDTIGLHLKNIYSESELNELSTTELFSVVQQEGKRLVKRKIKFYNLDAIMYFEFESELFAKPKDKSFHSSVNQTKQCFGDVELYPTIKEKAEALRQSILKKAFEGGILSEAEITACKQEPDYEPASVLLERIKKEEKHGK